MKLPGLIFVCIFHLLVCSAYTQSSSGKGLLTVHGDVKVPLTLSVSDLDKMKRVKAVLADHDGKEQTYSGVSLEEILDSAGVTLGKNLKGRNLAKYVLVKCADGYQVVLALAEIDRGFTDRVIILATEVSGKPLPENMGPFRLIVPGERRSARSGYQVTDIVIRTATEQR